MAEHYVDDLTLGRHLRNLRVDGPDYRNQRNAAVAVGISAVRLSQIEADRVKPTKDECRALCALYGAEVAELIHLWAAWTEAPPVDLNAPGVIVCRRPSPSEASDG